MAARNKQSHKTSLTDALFTTTQQKVLGLLFGQTESSFYASQIISLAGVGSGSVQRELQRLEESGLVTTRVIGTQKHYQANKDAPIFEELRMIAFKTFGVADALAEALRPLRAKIAWAIMYGSLAKGTDASNSDIDVLIISERVTLEEVFKRLDPVESKLLRKINPNILTRAEYTRRARSDDGYIARILKNNYVSLIGDKDAATATG